MASLRLCQVLLGFIFCVSINQCAFALASASTDALSPSDSWCVLTGVLGCVADTRVSQLQIAALDSLSQLLSHLRKQGGLSSNVQASTRSALQEVIASGKNQIVKAKAEGLVSQFS